MIINIGRQLGSGGREIGEKLAKTLGFAFFDKELMQAASEKSGVSASFFEKADENPSNGMACGTLLGIPLNFSGAIPFSGLTNETLFQIQSDTIRHLAELQSCVFVGRCADYILRERNDCFNVFICANEEDRLQRIEKHGCTETKAKERMEKTDKQRAEYYNFYTNKIWGKAESYDLCINSSILGIEGTIRFLLEFIRQKEQTEK